MPPVSPLARISIFSYNFFFILLIYVSYFHEATFDTQPTRRDYTLDIVANGKKTFNLDLEPIQNLRILIFQNLLLLSMDTTRRPLDRISFELLSIIRISSIGLSKKETIQPKIFLAILTF